MCSFPKYTKENYHITFFRLININSNDFHLNDIIKLIFIVQDMMFVTNEEDSLTEGEICVFDAKDFSIWHFFKLVSGLSAMKMFLQYVQEAVPHRLKQNHYVNCSPILTKIMTLIRPFVNKELNESMHFHTSGLDTFYEFIPRDRLPIEYGGTGGSLRDLHAKTLSAIRDHRNYLNNDDNWKLAK
jgi:retinaldehyde-binding protein 1